MLYVTIACHVGFRKTQPGMVYNASAANIGGKKQTPEQLSKGIGPSIIDNKMPRLGGAVLEDRSLSPTATGLDHGDHLL